MSSDIFKLKMNLRAFRYIGPLVQLELIDVSEVPTSYITLSMTHFHHPYNMTQYAPLKLTRDHAVQYTRRLLFHNRLRENLKSYLWLVYKLCH